VVNRSVDSSRRVVSALRGEVAGVVSLGDCAVCVCALMLARSIVNPDRKIVGIGYNGFPNGCGDDELPWGRSSTSGSPLETKYPVRHLVDNGGDSGALLTTCASSWRTVRVPRRDERHPEQELDGRQRLHGVLTCLGA
jgi:hypothetical protein